MGVTRAEVERLLADYRTGDDPECALVRLCEALLHAMEMHADEAAHGCLGGEDCPLYGWDGEG